MFDFITNSRTGIMSLEAPASFEQLITALEAEDLVESSNYLNGTIIIFISDRLLSSPVSFSTSTAA